MARGFEILRESTLSLDFSPAIRLIREFEGCKLTSYKDVVGVWTIGWGTTHNVKPGQVISQGEADQFMLGDLQHIETMIDPWISTAINNNQRCALLSFCYNLGVGAFHHSRLLSYLNSNHPVHAIASEFLRWDHAGGKVLAGLTRRRRAEAQLFLS